MALEARKLQYKISIPSHKHLIKNVEDKTQMENFPLGCSYVEGNGDIWGDNLVFLTGKNLRRKTPHIRSKLVPISMKIL